jgi:hypothetical protein
LKSLKKPCAEAVWIRRISSGFSAAITSPGESFQALCRETRSSGVGNRDGPNDKPTGPSARARSLRYQYARLLAENGNKDQAIDAAACETGVGREVLEAMIVKLLDNAKDAAVDHVKDQAAQAAKGMSGKFLGR